MFLPLINNFIKIVAKYSPEMLITSNFELVIEPKNNVYVSLLNIETEMDVKCKVIAWLSRPSCKGLEPKYRKIIRNIFNEVLGTEFNEDEIRLIYTRFGMSYEYDGIIKFIESGFDIEKLKESK